MKRRVLVSMVGVTTVAVLLFALPLAVAAGHLYRSREVTRLQRHATLAAGSLPPTGLRGPDPVDLPKAPRLVRLAIYDASGALVKGIGPSRAPSEVRAALAGHVNDDHDGRWLAVGVPVVDEENVVGAARAAVPWSVVTDRERTTWLGMFGLGLLAIGVAAALARRQAAWLSAPIGDVALVAERLGQGDFSARLDHYGIAEVDRAAGALNATAVRLGDLVARERAFSADASHQLSTPLTGLRLTLESALVTPDSDKDAAIGEAVGEVDRLQRTITTLLALARDATEHGEECDVGALCADAATRWHGVLAKDARPLRIDVESDMPSGLFSADALREILQVLLDNAVTHGRGEVTLRARTAGNGIVIEVEDEGDGITGTPESVFRRRSPDSTGHGIGLALARSLTEANGGRLVVGRLRPHPVFTLALRSTAHDEIQSAAP